MGVCKGVGGAVATINSDSAGSLKNQKNRGHEKNWTKNRGHSQKISENFVENE